jgi:hypothetical protein
MLFENTIKQLGWYFKGQITTWGVWIVGYYYGAKDVGGRTFRVRSKEISIPDSKANRKKFVQATKKFYTELKFPAYGFQSANDWKYKTDFTSDLWRSESAHYTCYITLDESKLDGLSLERLKSKALNPSNYQQNIDTRQFANGASVLSLLGFKIENCLTVEVSNTGSTNKGVENVDVFPYEFTSRYIHEHDGSPSFQTEKLTESDCNKHVRRILMNEVALFIDEIMEVKSSTK